VFVFMSLLRGWGSTGTAGTMTTGWEPPSWQWAWR
jgi:hypothetical protein